MSDDKKPKKDLRARLGRTISPNTPGAAPIATPNVAGAAPAAAPAAAAAAAAVPPPAIAPVVAPPVVAPPAAIAGPKLPFGGPDVAPPPFAQPKAPESVRPKAPVDPFAAGPAVAAGPQEVRLVIDDKPVDDSEVGRKQRGRNFLLLGIGLVVGALLGGGFGSMNGRNVLYNVTVRDGHEIYQTVTEASARVLDAQTKIDRLVERAAGHGGQAAGVDYDTITELRGMEVPISAGAFARKNYGAFQPGTVDDLFAYYNNVQLIWERIGRLAATTLNETRRAELDRTAAAAAESATALYGVVPVSNEEAGGIVGSLVLLEPIEGQTKLMARARRGGPGRELERFVADTEIGTTPATVLIVDGAQSAGVLSEQLGAFRQYVQDITELKRMMDQTVEIQGRLTTSLGEIARLQEVFAM
ncbi:hypothetical protein [Sandaracinus amylolyticus]|uniref:hypothetical protein n=1 Tax=Sandaracinus amylolyticus TaxID=927083 RepID=UPI001F1BC5CC|nr:hypothetical protein [Sandaracinus amylolyticus]UJR79882.1 Hypothetical protein I5071_19220 [Sandaracinus amylolyticus]